MAVSINPSVAGVDVAGSPFEGRTPIFVPIAQGAAGTTQLLAADATKIHKLIGIIITMSAGGTLKFIDSSGDLSGPMDVSATGGFIQPPQKNPIVQTGAVNRSISIVTTLGKANGTAILVSETE